MQDLIVASQGSSGTHAMWAALCALGHTAMHGLKVCGSSAHNRSSSTAHEHCGAESQLVRKYNLSVPTCREASLQQLGPNEWFWRHILNNPTRYPSITTSGQHNGTAGAAATTLRSLLHDAMSTKGESGRITAFVDSPFPQLLDEMLELRPAAKVVLSVCPSQQWAMKRRAAHGGDQICRSTPTCTRARLARGPCAEHRFSLVSCLGLARESASITELFQPLSLLPIDELAAAYDAFNTHVKAIVPPSQLLLINCSLDSNAAVDELLYGFLQA